MFQRYKKHRFKKQSGPPANLAYLESISQPLPRKQQPKYERIPTPIQPLRKLPPLPQHHQEFFQTMAKPKRLRLKASQVVRPQRKYITPSSLPPLSDHLHEVAQVLARPRRVRKAFIPPPLPAHSQAELALQLRRGVRSQSSPLLHRPGGAMPPVLVHAKTPDPRHPTSPGQAFLTQPPDSPPASPKGKDAKSPVNSKPSSPLATPRGKEADTPAKTDPAAKSTPRPGHGLQPSLKASQSQPNTARKGGSEASQPGTARKEPSKAQTPR